MISVQAYAEFMSELRARLEGDLERAAVLAVSENHLTTLLGDRQGTVLCGNLPSCQLKREQSAIQSDGEAIIYVLRKMPRDEMGTGREFRGYEEMQRIMSQVATLLMGGGKNPLMCDVGLQDMEQLSIEPEYNIYGGWNGWSILFHVKDKKGTDL